MPYTRNTRIRHLKKLNSNRYTAQVEYRIPLTNITYWEDFSDVEYGFLKWQFLKDFQGELPFRAERDCLHDSVQNEKGGLDWAKAVINRYHELFDEQEAGTAVEYIKYP